MTTAATTDFAIESIEFLDEILYFDGNQKICGDNGTFDKPRANAFSLPHISSCPFRTPTCEAACYVQNLEQHQSEVYQCYQSNYETIKRLLSKDYSFGRVAAINVGEWITQNAQHGFRWHVSGDIFSADYAHWIAEVVCESPTVHHWIYTRSFHLLEPLLELDNLTINLSADADNYWLAKRFADQHGLRVCYLTVDGEVPRELRDGDVIFPDYALRGVGMKPHTYREGSEWWRGLPGHKRKMVCPVDVYGKSNAVRCGPCRKCLDR